MVAFGVLSLGFRGSEMGTTLCGGCKGIMENEIEKKMQDDMEIGRHWDTGCGIQVYHKPQLCFQE